MKRLIANLFIIFLLLINVCYAQDIHFSQFNASPLTLNPAFTGVFSGDYRIILNYKDQWNSFTTGYKTFSTSADAALLRKKLENDFIGCGLVLYSDKAGSSSFGTTNVSFSASYNKALDYQKKQNLSFGIQGGIIQQGISNRELMWDTQWDGNQYDPTLSPGDITIENIKIFDLSTGVLWYYVPNSEISISSAIGVSHITAPYHSFFERKSLRLYRKFSMYLGGEYALNNHVSLIPNGIFIKQGPNQEINIGTYVKYIISRITEGEPSYLIGLWYRNKDALIVATRIDYRNYRFGFSYDINISPLRGTSLNRGGPEISFITIIPMPSKVKASHISCPGF